MSSSFGTVLKLQLFGESHGPAVGMCLDGFPAGFRPILRPCRPFWTGARGTQRPDERPPRGGPARNS